MFSCEIIFNKGSSRWWSGGGRRRCSIRPGGEPFNFNFDFFLRSTSKKNIMHGRKFRLGGAWFFNRFLFPDIFLNFGFSIEKNLFFFIFNFDPGVNWGCFRHRKSILFGRKFKKIWKNLKKWSKNQGSPPGRNFRPGIFFFEVDLKNK